MQWLIVDSATRSIVGWHRSPKAKELPAAQNGQEFVAATDDDIAAVESARVEASAQGRAVMPTLVEGRVGLPPDTRPRVAIEASKRSAGAGDSVVLTATATDADGKPFTGQQVIEGLGGRLLSFDFVDGVAQKTVRMDRSGKFELASTREVLIETKLDLTVIE
jgi:hypothetical protein